MRLLPLRSISYRGRFGNETPDNFDNSEPPERPNPDAEFERQRVEENDEQD